MNLHKGLVVPLVMFIIAVLALSGGAYVYTHSKNSPTPSPTTVTTTPSLFPRYTPIEPPIPLPHESIPEGWMIYTDIGVAFWYPPEYSKPLLNGDQIIVLAQSGASVVFQRESVAGHGCMASLCNAPAQSQLSANGVTWDYVGPAHYGETDPTSTTAPPSNKVYRTVHNSCRYYVTVVKEPRIESLLSTVQFTASDTTCPDVRG